MRTYSLVTGLIVAALLCSPVPAFSQSAPDLGASQSFAVLGGSGVTVAGAAVTLISGDTGSSPTAGAAISGFPPGQVAPGFTLYTTNDVAVQNAQVQNTAAYNLLASGVSNPCGPALPAPADQLGGRTLAPGVYCLGAADLTGTLNLSGGGIYVFKAASSLVTAGGSNIVLGPGMTSCDIYWQVTSSATLGAGSTFRGNIFALAGINLGTTANVTGRTWTKAAVTMAGGNTVGGCSAAPAVFPPTLGKGFSPFTLAPGAISVLTITLSNPDATVATLTAPFTDTLPAGVVIAPTPAAGTTCGGVGALSATAGGSTITLAAGRTIPALSSCTVAVNVTAAAGGAYVNTLAANALQTSNGNNAVAAQATLTVVAGAAPTLGKGFNPVTLAPGAISVLTTTLSNPGATVATLTAPFTDTLPAGVVIAPTPAAGTTCGGGGALSATAGGSTITLAAGRTIPALSTCTVTVNVTAAAAGAYVNNLAAGALQTSNGNNAVGALATLTVVAGSLPPTIGKGFRPFTLAPGAISVLTITLSNPDATVATLTAPFTDTLPAGVAIAPTPAAGTTCGGSGALSATAGGSTITLAAGRTIPAVSGVTPGTCTVTVNVTAAAAGAYVNNLAAGALQTSNGSNALAALTTLTVVAVQAGLPPTLAKDFDPFSIVAGSAVSTLTITLNNSDPAPAEIQAALVDTLPVGVVIAATPNAGTTCEGSGAVLATPGGNTVTLQPSGRIPGATGTTAGTCTVTVDVTAAAAGSYLNTLPANALKTSHGYNVVPATTTLTVVTTPIPPTPTLSERAMIALAALLSLAGFAAIRRRRAVV